jgi:hypothetical protein
MWFGLLMVAVAACGGSSTDAAVADGEADGLDLSGVNLEVHQEPG